MKLEQLYRIRFTYPESWKVDLEGGWEQHLYLAEGRCEGSISGRFRGVNFPCRQGVDGPFRPDFRAVIETDDRAVIMFDGIGTGVPTPRETGRSSARSSISAMLSRTGASTMPCASVSARCACRPTPIKPSLTS